MPTILHTGPADLLHVRFAVSPLFETSNAVRELHRREEGQHVPWLAGLGADASVGLEGLLALHPPRGYVPDFISPPPRTPSPRVEEQLDEVRRTPLEQVRRELAQGALDQPDPAARALLHALIRDPERARATLVAQLELAWERLLASHWPRLLALLESDIAHRSGVLASSGLRGMLRGLHPLVRATSDSIRLERGDDERDLVGEGLLLVPSAFVWPRPTMILDPPWQPSLVYPVRGIAELWRTPRPAPGALGRLLGETRARILTELDEPRSTTSLARGLGASPANVSVHLAVLRDGGLAVAVRRGREVRYSRSDLGSRLVERHRTR